MYVQFNAINLFVVGGCAIFCLLTCLYDLYTVLRRRSQTKQRNRLSQQYFQLLQELAHGKADSSKQDKKTYRKLYKICKRPTYMIALDMAMEVSGWSAANNPPKAVQATLLPLFNQLCKKYRRADDSIQGFILQLIDRNGVTSETIVRFTMDAMEKRSLYLRIQAMRSLSNYGDAELITQALRRVEGTEHYFSSKLITDTLMDFKGDHAKLGDALMKDLAQRQVETQCAVIAYAQNRHDQRLAEPLCKLFSASYVDKEAYIALLKFYGEVYHQPAYPYFVNALNMVEWEYVAVAAKNAGPYRTDEMVALLKQRLSHQNWYVRFNSAMTLVDMLGHEEAVFADVINGSDRYARDIIRYALASVTNR